MKTTILLVGHGSRFKAGNTEIENFAQNWREEIPERAIELCFIEFADILLDEGLDNAAKNAKRVIVVPLILNAAGHVKMEIPHHIEKARLRHPDIEFLTAGHLGANGQILKILKRKLHKTLQSLHRPDPKTTGVILLGRGSSDRLANGENAKMARYLFEESQHELVDTAFTGICFPRLETVVQRQIRLGMMQISILPYYLFTGTLMERIRAQLKRLQGQFPHICFTLGETMGFEPEIFELLDKRVAGAIEGLTVKCDCCNDPEVESAHHHHHHNEGAAN